MAPTILPEFGQEFPVYPFSNTIKCCSGSVRTVFKCLNPAAFHLYLSN
jgi:hypothetical protein